MGNRVESLPTACSPEHEVSLTLHSFSDVARRTISSFSGFPVLSSWELDSTLDYTVREKMGFSFVIAGK